MTLVSSMMEERGAFHLATYPCMVGVLSAKQAINQMQVKVAAVKLTAMSRYHQWVVSFSAGDRIVISRHFMQFCCNVKTGYGLLETMALQALENGLSFRYCGKIANDKL